MNRTEQKKHDMIMGAMVADAASMGLHWIYAQPRIRHAGGDTPEFTAPDPANYEGVPAYFAHARRRQGDCSMYGEALLVVLRSLADNGSFDWQHYAQAFQEHFGFGGEYVGYVDTPTRETLTNMVIANRQMLDSALSVPFDGTEKEKQAVASKVMGNAQLARGDKLREKVEEAIHMTKGSEAQVQLAHRMIEILEAERSFPGADDVQLPALTKVPVLVAAYADDPDLETRIDEAVRVSNNNDQAVDWALFHARLLLWSLQDDADFQGLEDAVRRIAQESPGHISEALEPMFKRMADDPKTVTMKIGPACELRTGVPVALHNLMKAGSYTEIIRRNILACGDTCGRAMLLGSLAGSLCAGQGDAAIPADWVSRTNRGNETEELINRVLAG